MTHPAVSLTARSVWSETEKSYCCAYRYLDYFAQLLRQRVSARQVRITAVVLRAIPLGGRHGRFVPVMRVSCDGRQTYLLEFEVGKAFVLVQAPDIVKPPLEISRIFS